MEGGNVKTFIRDVLDHMPQDWLNLTTHRLDIYDEKQAKFQFLEGLVNLFSNPQFVASGLKQLPTAYDYIRLGHPLSCVLEWAVAREYGAKAASVISFSSMTIPLIAILRENSLNRKNTLIAYSGTLPDLFNADLLRRVYGFQFELQQVNAVTDISDFNGTIIYLAQPQSICDFEPTSPIDFLINVDPDLGSIVLVNKDENESYIASIQHMRRRETIAMTPSDCRTALIRFAGVRSNDEAEGNVEDNKKQVLDTIQEITGTQSTPVVASSGLSMQYAIVMGLIQDAQEQYPGKAIKIVVPPNCYGGTNDQARRVAASTHNVEVMDLPVDSGSDMVQSVEVILATIAHEDAVPYIIAEIPTNPRVEVPDLEKLRAALSKERKNARGEKAIDPVFILDQTFCPNTPFLGDNDVLSSVRALSYVSGSKFPSGGRCTAGYCVANKKAAPLMDKIVGHLQLCDNEATDLQYEVLAAQMPSMNQRIEGAYQNTRAFVNFIQKTLPTAKINFVSEELAAQGFTPSVFSLDLPTKGSTEEEREMHKRKLNHQLIDLMIHKMPNESKHCVSYGQLKGCYWTIPATSTQGTTKEGDKDYIARVALSPEMDLERHKEVFMEFVGMI